MPEINKSDLPEALRMAIRGIGGQGNYFLEKCFQKLL